MITPIFTGIVDTYHGDGAFNLEAVRAGGVEAVFYKCSEGSTVMDSGYVQAMDRLKTLGFLRGTYHFARGTSDAVRQADLFADDVQCFADTHGDDILPVLDLEGDPKSFLTMSTADAARFLERARERLKRWPLLYMGASKGRTRMRNASPAELDVFRQVELWLAWYQRGDPTALPAFDPWPTWTLLQYTDGRVADSPRDTARFPNRTPGFAREAQDRSCFRGTVEQLRAWWLTYGR